MVFARLEPFGSEADMQGHALTSSVIANANRGKNDKPYKVEDFMPKYKKTSSPEQMKQVAQMVTLAQGGQDLRDG
jgi:2C-methyl-D-erythritol 2,4-cyclodiphosphate synthase